MLTLTLAAGRAVVANAQPAMTEFYDRDYGYIFQHPPGWEVRELPEGQGEKAIRVVLQSPNGGSFVVVVEKLPKPVTRDEFGANPDRVALVDRMMDQTIAQIYTSISRDIKADKMKVGDRRDLSNDTGVKFYISTLHSMEKGNAIIVAGIHVIPFSGPHMINFVMTTLWDPAAEKNNETLMAVFNSFRLIGEKNAKESSPKP